MTRHRVALVGAGVMGSHHARVIAGSDRADLSLVVDPRQREGMMLAEKFSAKWAPELPDLTDIDAVVIAAATEAHYSLAMSVLSESVALLVEKPVADSIERTEDIVSAAARLDTPLMCGLLERFNPAILTARTMLGEPFHITGTRHSPYAERIKTGVAWDLLVHDVDLAITIMGSEPTQTTAQLGFFNSLSRPDAEDVAEAQLIFGGGQIAQISASRMGQRKIRAMSIYEHNRMIEIDLLRRDVTVFHHVSENSADGEGRGYKQQTVIEIPELITSREPLVSQFDHFMDLLDGKVDATTERASILPSHRAIAQVTALRPTGVSLN